MKVYKNMATMVLSLCLVVSGAMTMGSSNAFAKSSTVENVTEDADLVGESVDEKTIEEVKLSDFVEIKKKESSMGIVEYPVFLEEKLDATDVKKVNKLFNTIKKDKWKTIKELIKLYDEEDKKDDSYRNYYLMKTKVAMSDDLISTLVIYGDHYSSVKWIEAVNFNIKTGKLMSPNEVLKKFGYTKKEVNKVARSYGRATLIGIYENLKNYGFNYDENRIAKKSILKFADEIDSVNYRKYYYSKYVKKFKVPRYPAVFVDEIKNLYVGAAVPIIAGAGFSLDLIPMGHSYGEKMRAKADNPKNATAAEKNLKEAGALDRISEIYAEDPKNISLVCDGKELVENINENRFEPAFLIKAFYMGKDAISTDSYWTVGMESGTVWKMNDISLEWEIYSMADKETFKNNVLKTIDEKKGIVAIYTNPNQYQIWVQRPIANFNLCKSAKSNTKDKNRFLLYNAKDGIEIELQSGVYEANEFKGKEIIDKIMLKRGECVAITTYRDDMELKAIVIKDKDKIKKYILTGKEAVELLDAMETICK